MVKQLSIETPFGVFRRVSRAGRFSAAEPTIRGVSPAELAAEFHQLRELAPAFGVRTLRRMT